MRIGFIGFGEAAQAFVASLRRHNPRMSFIAWDTDTSPAMARAMAGSGVTLVEPAAFSGADWVFSAVTADQSLIAVQTIAPHICQGQWLIDINSVSPKRKVASAALIEAAGGHYLDMAVMAPVLPRGHATPVLIAGAQADEIAPLLSDIGFAARIIGPEPGQATAIKMIRSLFVKGLEAITVEALLAAEAAGCGDEILASLSGSYPGLGWPDIATYQFERSLKHGGRRAAEMVESAATIADLGLNAALPHAIADTHRAMGQIGAQSPSLAPDQTAQILAARLAQKEPKP
ncbi:MAG: NAD(P)-dependent oxidoreductase [Rhodobacteraceae bacterium]|nr:NAD(P)-dependent oxidoreductase [Paracoccaceae bacterium]